MQKFIAKKFPAPAKENGQEWILPIFKTELRYLAIERLVTFSESPLYAPGHRDVMTGMRGNLVLIINRVDFLVCIIYKHIFCSVFLHALCGTVGMLLICALRPALAIRNVAGPGAIRGECKSCHA